MLKFEMPGLRADNPQGWMAAIGLLLVLDRQGKAVQLSWQQLIPSLYGIDYAEVIKILLTYLRDGSQALEELTSLPKNPEKNKIALDFTAGRVSFTNVIDHMTKMVTEEHINHCLTQPWTNTADEVSLGWDPYAVKQAATLTGDKAPDSAKHRTELGGQWLAAESLAITCPPPHLLKDYFQWVTWQVPLDLEGVYSVVQARSEAWHGIRYRSQIGFSGNFRFFLPPVRL